eukprot:TRINITY_DN12259_c0_g2_i1.p1 TRINITY_DN12259_c0_g2~~TRINITY_DN12259_c0_g2_i1.p1  ORF type:complete len:227 (-),score=64.91 TRINITY_DN12259_c0_g2_i1:146-826(-)
MGCGASAQYAPAQQPEEKAGAEVAAPALNSSSLRGEAWIAECRNLVSVLQKLDEVLRELLLAKAAETPGSPKGDRRLALQLLRDDAAAERARLERRLAEDPHGRDPIDLPDLAAALLRTLVPLVGAPAAPTTASGAQSDALVLLSEHVESLALVAVAAPDGRSEDETALQLRSGTSVRIHGLVSAPELNGRTGTTEAFDAGAGRWTVRLLVGGELKSVKPCNLEIL